MICVWDALFFQIFLSQKLGGAYYTQKLYNQLFSLKPFSYECPGYDTKPIDSEASVLEFWGM